MKNLTYNNVNQVKQHFETLYGLQTAGQEERYERAFANFKKKFGVDSCYVASSPGRVEVCGNHTDHNGGNVLSCAISLDTLALFIPSEGDSIIVESEGYGEIKVDLSDLTADAKPTSASLIKGVAAGLKDRGYKIGGFKGYISSNVAGGAGISSSASFEVLIAEILNVLYNDGKIDNETKSYVAQYSENVYFGKPCGLLDQTAIAFGGLKKLDFSNTKKIGVTDITDNIKDFTLILINTGGSHANLTDEYASIPAEMKHVATALGCERLVELSEEEFYNRVARHINVLSDREILRATHFYSENNRVNNGAKAIENGDLDGFLSCIKESGLSSLWQLQNCYVPSKEQPIPKAIALSNKFLKTGACRVHGGGFAGCVLNIIKNDEVSEFVENMSRYYKREDIIILSVRPVGAIVL